MHLHHSSSRSHWKILLVRRTIFRCTAILAVQWNHLLVSTCLIDLLAKSYQLFSEELVRHYKEKCYQLGVTIQVMMIFAGWLSLPDRCESSGEGDV